MHITKYKKPIWKNYILYNSHSVTLWKRLCNPVNKTIERVKESVIARGWGERGMNRQSTEDFNGTGTTLYDRY